MGLIKALTEFGTQRTLRRVSSSEHFEFLRRHPLLQDIGDRGFLFLFDRIVERLFGKDELIFKQDNLGVCLFVVRSGSVLLEVTAANDDSVVLVNRASEGDIFGEMSVITEQYRTATARADAHDTTLLAMSSFDLNDFRTYHPADSQLLLRGLTDLVCKNLATATREAAVLQAELQRLQSH
ncbi:MAG TPA: hypothetical protein DCR55_07545 [Lentisphaeria bacterium]|jgi:CRP-like cAMP-binding protein|nr:hypothetical protein [Lentisphaeria bacterium]